MKPQEFLTKLEQCTQYPLSEWSAQLGVVNPAPATAAAAVAASVGGIAQTAAQQHSMGFQLRAAGFAVGGFCAIKEESESTTGSKKEQLKVWEIVSINDQTVELKDPNGELHGKGATTSVATADAVVKKLLQKRTTFKKQVEVTPIGVTSSQVAVDLAIDVARRAVQTTHAELSDTTSQLRVFKNPTAVMTTASFKKDELKLVPTSNKFGAVKIGRELKKSERDLMMGEILGHSVVLRKHAWKEDDEGQGGKPGEGSDELWQAPFWFVPTSDTGNMRMRTHEVDIVTDTGVVTVSVPIMVNVKEIRSGTELTCVTQKRKRS